MSALRYLALPIGFAVVSVAIANVNFVSQERLSVGTSFDVGGSEFKKRPAVWLDFAGRRIPLKVAKGGTDTLLHATLTSIPNGVHGDCMLKMRPRGASVPFSLGGLSIELPDVSGVTPATGAAAAEVTIDGTFFGSKKGRVDFGTKHGKIISWTDTQIHALVPKGVPPGDVLVGVTTKAGSSLEVIHFTIAQ